MKVARKVGGSWNEGGKEGGRVRGKRWRRRWKRAMRMVILRRRADLQWTYAAERAIERHVIDAEEQGPPRAFSYAAARTTGHQVGTASVLFASLWQNCSFVTKMFVVVVVVGVGVDRDENGGGGCGGGGGE